MPCIFGFGFHEWFSPSHLSHVRKLNVIRDSLVCERCERKLQDEYEDISQAKEWRYDIRDFINFHIIERLLNLRSIWENIYPTEKQLEKFGIMYDAFMDYAEGENSKDLKVQSMIAYSVRQNHKLFCECCTLQEPLMLTIDHVNDNKIYCYNCNLLKALTVPCTRYPWLAKLMS